MGVSHQAQQYAMNTKVFLLVCALSFFFAGCGNFLVTNAPIPRSEISFSPQVSGVGELIEITSTSRSLSGVTSVMVGAVSQVIVSTSTNRVAFLLVPGTVTGKVAIASQENAFASLTNLTVTASASPNPVEALGKSVAAGAIGFPSLGIGVSSNSDGSTVLVGGFRDNANVGAAFVFTKVGSTWIQQAKLVASDSVGTAFQGFSSALSADGNTAVVGMRIDNANVGAAVIFVRDSNGNWSQQGPKLVGSDRVGAALMGVQVAISADGNTVLVGGSGDNASVGAAWVFKRAGGVWTQDGSKLVGADRVGAGNFGVQVALNDAGDRALVSAHLDDGGVGATFVFQRSGGVWAQVGNKLVGTGGSATAAQGSAVAFNSAGTMALVGGYNDGAGVGAMWFFTEIGGVWSQVGAKFSGTGNIGASYQSFGCSLSADGNTAAIGGYNDNAGVGAVWIFSRESGSWSQIGAKITGSGTTGAASFGRTLSLSRNGKVLVVGAPGDNANTGAFWIYNL